MFPVLVLLLAFAVHQGSSIHCYNCNGTANAACEDPFDSSQFSLVDCDEYTEIEAGGTRVCMKIVQEYPPGVIAVLRTCIPEETMRRHFSRIGRNYPYTCNTDGCNAAPGPILPSIITLLITAVSYVFCFIAF